MLEREAVRERKGEKDLVHNAASPQQEHIARSKQLATLSFSLARLCTHPDAAHTHTYCSYFQTRIRSKGLAAFQEVTGRRNGTADSLKANEINIKTHPTENANLKRLRSEVAHVLWSEHTYTHTYMHSCIVMPPWPTVRILFVSLFLPLANCVMWCAYAVFLLCG